MEDKTDKYLKEIIKDIKLESPSKDFTKNVMKKISLEEKTVNQAKISFIKKYKFMLIFSITFICIFLIVFFFSDGQSSLISDNIDVKSVDYSFLDKIRDFFNIDFKISPIYILIIIAGGLLFSLDSIIPKISKRYVEGLTN